MQAKLNLDAQKIAGMRSKDALCGLIIGDKASWEGSVKESLKDQVQEFEDAQGGDPLAKESPAAVKKLAAARETLVSRLESTDLYQSAGEASCRRASTARRGSTKTTPGPMGCRSTPPAFPTPPQRPGGKCKKAGFFSR